MTPSRLIVSVLTAVTAVGMFASLVTSQPLPAEVSSILVAVLGAALVHDKSHGHKQKKITMPFKVSSTPTHLVITRKKAPEKPAKAPVDDWHLPGCKHTHLTPVRTPAGEIVNWLCAEPKCCKALSLPEAGLGFDVVLPPNHADDIYPLEEIVGNAARPNYFVLNIGESVLTPKQIREMSVENFEKAKNGKPIVMPKNKAELLGPNYCNQHDDDVRECCGLGTTKSPPCAHCGYFPPCHCYVYDRCVCGEKMDATNPKHVSHVQKWKRENRRY